MSDFTPILARYLTKLRPAIVPPTNALLFATNVLIPPDPTPDSPGTDVAETPYITPVGEAVVISNRTTAIPTTAMTVKTRYVKYETVAGKFGVTYQDLERFAEQGMSKQALEAQLTVRTVIEKLDRIQYYGSQGTDLQGYSSHPNIGVIVLPSDGNLNGGTASPRFRHKTPDQVLRDLNTLANSVTFATNGIIHPDVIGLGLDAYTWITQTPYVSGSGETNGRTIYSVFMENQSKDVMFGIKAIVQVSYLNSITSLGGNGTADGAMVWSREANHIHTKISKSPSFNPPVQSDLGYTVAVDARTAGITVCLPEVAKKCLAV